MHSAEKALDTTRFGHLRRPVTFIVHRRPSVRMSNFSIPLCCRHQLRRLMPSSKRDGTRHGLGRLSSKKMSLSPPPPHRETYWSRIRRRIVRNFLQSKSVNNVCKLLQFLGDFISRPIPRPRPWNPLGVLHPHSLDPLGYDPEMKITGAGTSW